MRKFEMNPAVVIFSIGLCGLILTLVEGPSEIGSKVPLSLFFIFIMIIGIGMQMAPKDKMDGVFGEVEGGFG